ncbi:MAG: hypothetical protein N3A38_01660 [Planctomycetota bacterium]|nr:hypothetical protein [Planctomycetota bacterium]
MKTHGPAWNAVAEAAAGAARAVRCAVAVGIAVASAGCIKVECTVRIEEDGSGRVTETVKFSPKLLRLAANLEGGKGAETAGVLLSEQRVRERAALMGEGVSVESCRIEDTADGGRQVAAVYAFRDINRLKLCMFPLGKGWESGHITFQYVAERNPKGHFFHLNYAFEHWRRSGGPPTTGESKGRPFLPISETELQKVRRLLPVFKDMIEGFTLKVKVEIYDREKWASVTKGIHPSFWGYDSPLLDVNRSGGRAVILDIRDSDLMDNDDALMVLVPWRQTENFADFRLHQMIGCPLPVPFYITGGMRWKAIQHAESREYH